MAKHLVIDRSLNFLVESLLIFIIFFSPLIYGGITIEPLSLLESLSFLLLFIFILRVLFKERISLIKIPALPLLIFLLLIVLQLLPISGSILSFLSPSTFSLYKSFNASTLNCLPLSIYREATVNTLVQVLSFVSIFFVALNYINTKTRLDRLVVSIVICGFLYSFYGVIQKTGGFSTFTNRNHFAAYVEMIIPLTICLLLKETFRPKIFILIFVSMFQIIALASSLSRAGLLIITLSITGLFVLLRMKGLVRKNMFIFMLLPVLIYFLRYVDLNSIVKRACTLASPLGVMSGRAEVLRDSARIIKDFPIFGTGFGTFGQVFHIYQTSGPYRVYSFCHNEPVQLLVEMGIFGFAALLIFFLKYLRNIFYLWNKATNVDSVYITLGAMAGIFSISTHSLFDFVFHIPANAVLFFIMLALAYKNLVIRESTGSSLIQRLEFIVPKSWRNRFLAIACALFVLIESLVVQRYRAEALFKKVNGEDVSVNDVNALTRYQSALQDVDKAIQLNSFNSFYLLKKADLFSDIAQGEQSKDLAGLEEFGSKGECFQAAEKYYTMAVNANPTNSEIHLRLGWLYYLLDRKDMARMEFKKTSLLDARNIAIHIYLCRYYLSIDDQEDFFYHLTKAVQIYRLYPNDHIAGTNVFPDFLKEIGYAYLIK